MNLSWVYDHHNGKAEWERRDLYDWLSDVFEQPTIRMGPRVTNEIRKHVRNEFESNGWAMGVRIDPDYDLTVFAQKDDLAFQLQTGNMSRAPYDLLKLQYLYSAQKVEAVALALPTKAAAESMGSNIAHAERVTNELQLFSRIITVPAVLIAFE